MFRISAWRGRRWSTGQRLPRQAVRLGRWSWDGAWSGCRRTWNVRAFRPWLRRPHGQSGSKCSPAHMGQGSRVTYRVHWSKNLPPKNSDAEVKACISACAVKSRSRSHRLWARAMTWPCATITAPTGTSSNSAARSASCRARRMKRTSSSLKVAGVGWSFIVWKVKQVEVPWCEATRTRRKKPARWQVQGGLGRWLLPANVRLQVRVGTGK